MKWHCIFIDMCHGSANVCLLSSLVGESMRVLAGFVTHLASRARAIMPAARGAEADVPVCESVHLFLRSVVTCTHTHAENSEKLDFMKVAENVQK